MQASQISSCIPVYPAVPTGEALCPCVLHCTSCTVQCGCCSGVCSPHDAILMCVLSLVKYLVADLYKRVVLLFLAKRFGVEGVKKSRPSAEWKVKLTNYYQFKLLLISVNSNMNPTYDGCAVKQRNLWKSLIGNTILYNMWWWAPLHLISLWLPMGSWAEKCWRPRGP